MNGRISFIICASYIIFKVVEIILQLIGRHGDFGATGTVQIIYLGLNFGAIMINCINLKLDHRFLYGDLIFTGVAYCYLVFILYSKTGEGKDKNLKDSNRNFSDKDYDIMLAVAVVIVQTIVFALVLMICNPKKFFRRIRNVIEGNNENELMDESNTDIERNAENETETVDETNDIPLADLPPSYGEVVEQSSQVGESYTPPPNYEDIIKSPSQSTVHRQSSLVSSSSQDSSAEEQPCGEAIAQDVRKKDL